MKHASDPRGLESLLVESAWARALARRLCADAATADDLVQDAWLAALEKPPTGAHSVRAWLAQVIENLARARGRSESARRARERRSARGEATEGTVDVVARAQSSRRLAEHVLALDEPYRSTILSRWFDGVSAEEIAAREGVPASTVRTRLERGLARLRTRLEREHGRATPAMLAALALDTAPALASATAAPAGTQALATSVALGGFTMAATLKVAIALAAVVSLVWIVLPQDGEPARTQDPSVATPAGTTAVEATALSSPHERRPASGSSTPTSTASVAGSAPRAATLPTEAELEALVSDVPPGTLEGIVLRGREPLERGTVYVWRGHWRPLPDDPSEHIGPLDDGRIEAAAIDTRGRFRIAPLRTGWYTLGVDDGGGVGVQEFVEVSEDAAGRTLVIVLGDASIEGTVYDIEGRPIAGANVRANPEDPSRSIEHNARTDGVGRYAIRGLRAGPHWVLVDRLGRRGPAAALEDMRRLSPPLAEGETRVVDFGTPARAAAWTGRLVTRGGAVVPNGGRLGWKDLATGAYSEAQLARDAPFELRLAPGAYELQVTLTTSEAGHGTGYVDLGKHQVAGDVERDLVLPGTRVVARVRNAADIARPSYLALVGVDGQSRANVEIAPDGVARFEAVEDGTYTLVASPIPIPGGDPTVVVLEGEVELELDVRLAPR